jgi:hypothetical protein
MVVSLWSEGALVNFSEHELEYHMTGTRWIWVVNSALMMLFITNLGFILEVKHGSIHSSQVLSLAFSFPSRFLFFLLAFSSHSCVVDGSLVFLPSPAIAMPHERGKLKCGPTCYKFMARRLRPGPSLALVPTPSYDAAPTLENLPFTNENWVGNEGTEVFIEEEHPLVPPQVPRYSCLFSTSNLHASPLHSSHQIDVDPTSSMETCRVEEEMPSTLKNDKIQVDTQPGIQPQPVADSLQEALSLCLFSEEGLQLIIALIRDAADKLHRQTILCRRLDSFFNYLSNEPVKRRCPTCNQLYVFSPAWPHPPSGDGNSGSFGLVQCLISIFACFFYLCPK